MNLAHALYHHPHRDEEVWGLKCLAAPGTSERHDVWCWALGQGSFQYFKIPTTHATLRKVVEWYHFNLNHYSCVRIVRFIPGIENNAMYLMDEKALSTPTYQPPSVYDRLKKLGAKYPGSDIYLPNGGPVAGTFAGHPSTGHNLPASNKDPVLPVHSEA